KAAGAMQRDQNGADIPDKPLFVRTLGIVDSYPAGCPIPYPGPVAPDGYLLMDGRAFSKTLYPQLANLYPDGKLPDMRGMFVRGLDNVGRIDKSGINNSLSIANPELPSDWTSNGHTPVIQASIGGLSRRYVYDSGLDSVRGYRLVCDYTAHFPSRSDYKLYETTRTLLSTQYINSYSTNPDIYFNGTHNFRVTEKDPYKDKLALDYDAFPSLKNEIKKRNISLVKTLLIDGVEHTGEVIRNIMEQSGDRPESNFVKLSDILPSAAPNVAFNYITKAA
ncbi:tail fiber protein, partial [Salmonella enterica]|nr:tail fiber protein [Salmonella enterica]